MALFEEAFARLLRDMRDSRDPAWSEAKLCFVVKEETRRSPRGMRAENN